MARRGRKRKVGQRKPCGRLKPEKQEKGESAQVIALRQPHRRDAPPEMSDDQRAETPLGRLYLIGAVSSGQYAAARRYARIAALYHRDILAPRHSPPSIAGAFEPRWGRVLDEDDAHTRKADYDSALEALEQAGRAAAYAVNRMSVYGEPCTHRGFAGLIRGLNALERHFEIVDRLTSPNKSETVRNAG